MSGEATHIEVTTEQLAAQLADMQKRLDVLTAAHNAHVTGGHVHSLEGEQLVTEPDHVG